MDVTVYKTEFIFPMPQGSAITKFELTGIEFKDLFKLNFASIVYE